MLDPKRAEECSERFAAGAVESNAQLAPFEITIMHVPEKAVE
jgi:hypothetical protein